MNRADKMSTKALAGEQILASGGTEKDSKAVRGLQTGEVAPETEAPCCCPHCFPF